MSVTNYIINLYQRIRQAIRSYFYDDDPQLSYYGGDEGGYKEPHI